jgi:hypothetical protein
MPNLITNITGGLLDTYSTNFYVFNSLEASIQFEDYVNMNGFIAYLQNFTEVNKVQYLQKPFTFGLQNQYNIETSTLNISY